MIESKYQFTNYNGLHTKVVKINDYKYLDNKVVIIDEVHNLTVESSINLTARIKSIIVGL